MSLDKNLTNRIFSIAIQAESAVLILINQEASVFGTDVSGRFFASPPKKFTGPIEAMRHPHFHDRASRKLRGRPSSTFLAVISPENRRAPSDGYVEATALGSGDGE